MKVFLQNLTLTASIYTVLTFATSLLPVVAGETSRSSQTPQGLRRISQDTATGQSGSEIPLIELSPGYGVNISFISSGEIVEKVWLDNPAIASLDVDGCLSGLGRECNSPGATVLHLRRINPIDIPQLPKMNSSLLTVVAKGNSGRRVYLFRVATANAKPKYHTIEVTPHTQEQPEIRELLPHYQNLQAISRGLEIAQKQRLISPESPLWQRIKNFLTNVKSGESISNAARKAGITLQLVNRLIELGQTTPVNTLRQRLVNQSNYSNKI
ncbi:hypothetical protein H6G41_24075 [Tolypothrix sp. FACHB-123]|uniref:hypothetical protein n=1 Tax=Tolypothrix sp. FACHB-123 TaxID=2692868 RepID=UPI0016825852|nr:hypothetical protein [Tolypothrix sp. FACHB-123]MBD2357650.1 hypothetical protein [Tolypothrix sp. FACHB-123]